MYPTALTAALATERQASYLAAAAHGRAGRAESRSRSEGILRALARAFDRSAGQRQQLRRHAVACACDC